MEPALRAVAPLLLAVGLLSAPAGARPGIAHVADGPRQTADALFDRLVDFLAWAHPAGGGCGTPMDVAVTDRTAEEIVAHYEVLCQGVKRGVEAILETRQGESVWQVTRGFEIEPAGPRAAPPALAAVDPPHTLEEPRPEYPEEAGRARLIGKARVELLVEIGADGAPERARPLRGPDPDLGMRRAAIEAVLKWRFAPATLGGKPVRYFAPVGLTFEGLPPESRSWTHRALFHIDVIVSATAAPIEEAQRRLAAGEPFEGVAAAAAAGGAQAGDWGFVSAATLPPAVRKALHDIQVGGLAGPIEAEGLHYLMLKRGEIYYGIRSAEGGDVSYQIEHLRDAPRGEVLRRAVAGDIADYLAESRRRAYVNEAARRMGIRQREARIGQLLIHTDALDDEEITTLGRVVEAAIEAHRRFWETIVPLRPFKEQVLVYAFARTSDHNALYSIWRGGRAEGSALAAGPAGEYVPSSRILAIPCEEMEGHLPVPVLVHEALHMLDYERVYAAGVTPSRWFEEGLATYFGFSQITSRLRIEPGEIHRSGAIESGSVKVQFDPRAPLREYLREIGEARQVALGQLLRAGPGDPLWIGDRSFRGYGASWTLIHFLKDGDKKGHLKAFQEYACLEARGEAGPEAFARVFGPDLGAFERAWHDYEAGL
jgi:TonB family protein